MKSSFRLIARTVFAPLLLALGFWLSPVWASEAKKAVVPEVEEKKFKYANEEGATGRSGYVYKRALRPNDEEPKPKIWEPAKEPPPPAKDEVAKDAKPSDKKVDKKEEAPAPKKEEKKDAKAETPSKAKPSAAPEVPMSAVYDAAVIKLDATHRPLTKVVQSNAYADYFLCRKTITDKYRDLVLDEINTFADRMDLPRAQDTPCMVKVAKPNTKLPGAIYIEFYVNELAAKTCIKTGECGSTRVMMLYPKDKTGKKSKDVYRSYVLTDERKFRRASYCVSPQGQLLGDKSCYVAVNPDWLFN